MFLLLQQEGYVFRSSIAQGLTALRRAGENDKGSCYSAFFNLSIGIERLLKVIIIADHMCRNGMVPPSNRQLKDYGHNILQLLEVTQRINLSHRPKNPLVLLECERRLFTFLDEFGTGARYYNLDKLGGASQKRDPLGQWPEVLESILAENGLGKRVSLRQRKAVAMASRLSPIATVFAHGLDQRPLTLEDGWATAAVHDLACKYAVYHVVRILAELRELIMTLSYCAWEIEQKQGKSMPSIPRIDEFLDFLYTEKRAILNKVRWP